MALFLESFTCDRCGRSTRRVGADASMTPALCSTCSDELTAEAAAAHATLLWLHRS